MKNTILALVATSCLTLSAVVQAGPFFIIDGSYSDANLVNLDRHGSAYGLSAGYQFGENWAVSLGYTDYSEVETVTDNSSYEVDAESWDITLTGLMPLAENFGLYGKLGVDYWDTEGQFANVNGLGSGSLDDDDFDAYIGAGASVYLPKGFTVNLEYEVHKWGDLDMKTIGLSLKYHLGHSADESEVEE